MLTGLYRTRLDKDYIEKKLFFDSEPTTRYLEDMEPFPG